MNTRDTNQRSLFESTEDDFSASREDLRMKMIWQLPVMPFPVRQMSFKVNEAGRLPLISFKVDEAGVYTAHDSRHKEAVSRRNRANSQALTLVESASVLLPRKVSDEQIGDLKERLADLEADGTPDWRIQAHALRGVFWALAYTARDFVKSGAIVAGIWKLFS